MENHTKIELWKVYKDSPPMNGDIILFNKRLYQVSMWNAPYADITSDTCVSVHQGYYGYLIDIETEQKINAIWNKHTKIVARRWIHMFDKDIPYKYISDYDFLNNFKKNHNDIINGKL